MAFHAHVSQHEALTYHPGAADYRNNENHDQIPSVLSGRTLEEAANFVRLLRAASAPTAVRHPGRMGSLWFSDGVASSPLRRSVH